MSTEVKRNEAIIIGGSSKPLVNKFVECIRQQSDTNVIKALPLDFQNVEKQFTRSTTVILMSTHHSADSDNPFGATMLAQVVINPKHFPSLDSVADHITEIHRISGMFSDEFPDPRVIDDQNQRAYSSLAPVFIDQLRITTRDFHEASVEELRRIVNTLGSGSRGVEVGSGRRWLTQSVDFNHVNLTLHEASKPMIDFSDEIEKDDSINSPIRALPFKNNELDFIVGSLVDGMMYPHALLEFKRVLKPGGQLVVSYPSFEWTLANRNGAKFAEFVNNGKKIRAYSFSPARSDLERLFDATGFDITSFKECPSIPHPKEYYSPALFDSKGNLPNSVVTVTAGRVK